MNAPALPVKTDQAAALLKAMGNERRLCILLHLADGEKTVGALERLVGLSQSALSQHLAVLRLEQVVRTRRQAQTIFYALNGEPVAAVLSALSRIYPAVERNPANPASSHPAMKDKPPNGATAPMADGPNQPSA